MMQNFEPIELERNFDFPELNHFGNHQEEISKTHDSSHVACSTPNPPWWCEEQAMAVNVDAYTPILILIAVVVGLMKLQKFKSKT